MPDRLLIRRESPAQPEVVALLSQLDDYLHALYPPEANHIVDVDALQAPDIGFFVARDGTQAVGTGAFRRMAGEPATGGVAYGEIKRMYVDPAFRGRDIGGKLLDTIEAQLRAEGYGLVLLETGFEQLQAVKLYKRRGYTQRAAFGGYPDNGLSAFYGKTLQNATLPKLSDDDFSLFGLPQQQALDRTALDARRRELQAQVHPDRFASEGAAAQRIAMQWAVRVNEAYQRLKSPLTRAAYLCALRGVAIDAERNTAMPTAFLMQQMAWREALDDAGTAADVQALDDTVAADERQQLAELTVLLDERADTVAAAALVRALMFVHRFRQDLERRLDTFDAR